VFDESASTNICVDIRLDQITNNAILVDTAGSLFGNQFIGLNVDLGGDAAIKLKGTTSGCKFQGTIGRSGCYYHGQTLAAVKALGAAAMERACNVAIDGNVYGCSFDLAISYNQYSTFAFPQTVVFLNSSAVFLNTELAMTGTFNVDGTVYSALNTTVIKNLVDFITTTISLSSTKFKYGGLQFGAVNSLTSGLTANPFLGQMVYAGADPTTIAAHREAPLAKYGSFYYIGVPGGNYVKITTV
jgi:hypothetical protein